MSPSLTMKLNIYSMLLHSSLQNKGWNAKTLIWVSCHLSWNRKLLLHKLQIYFSYDLTTLFTSTRSPCVVKKNWQHQDLLMNVNISATPIARNQLRLGVKWQRCIYMPGVEVTSYCSISWQESSMDGSSECNGRAYSWGGMNWVFLG